MSWALLGCLAGNATGQELLALCERLAHNASVLWTLWVHFLA